MNEWIPAIIVIIGMTIGFAAVSIRLQKRPGYSFANVKRRGSLLVAIGTFSVTFVVGVFMALPIQWNACVAGAAAGFFSILAQLVFGAKRP